MVFGLLLSSCNSTPVVTSPSVPDATLRQQLAQKLMLDFRFYCQPGEQKYKYCRKPLTQLPTEIADLITNSDLGGVILFADNLESTEQVVKLNHELHQTSQQSTLKLPLFVSVDQEGGRVARLPRQTSTAFTGSLSIAATHAKYGTWFAKQTGDVLGKELAAVGFNLNFAPNVDVNINPNNPVINVRSFGEDPKVVSELAGAQLAAMQQHGLLGTLKHFPGHGDTSVDSHTGLPRVEHSLIKIKQVDLAPFQYAINNKLVNVIMTAHIQYPKLDNSMFVSKDGKSMIKPATMSRKILTDLLRGQMGYQGLIVTDALDMRGVSSFFNEQQAVIETFKAGADIALMPIKIRKREDFIKLEALLDTLENAVLTGQLNRAEVEASYKRIVKAKRSLNINFAPQTPIAQKVKRAKAKLASPESRNIELALAKAAITAIKGSGQLSSNTKSIQLFMPDPNKCLAISNALKARKATLQVNCMDYLNYDLKKLQQGIKQADVFVAASLTPKQSLAEMGGMDDLPRLSKQVKKSKINKWSKPRIINSLLSFAKQQNKQTVFISLRMPYEATKYVKSADHLLTTYSYNQYEDGSGKVTGAAYEALASVLLGRAQAVGDLPVSIR